MSAALLSNRWHRIAGLRPQLRPQVQLRRQLQRGETWYLLQDLATIETRRINPAAWAFIGRLDGRRSVDEVWQELLRETPDEAPTQDEILALMVQLADRRLIQFDARGDIEAMFQRRRDQNRQVRMARANPLAFRLSLGNPTRVLVALEGLGRRLFAPAGAALWLALVLAAGLAAIERAPGLIAHAGELMGSTRWLPLAFVLYPVIKLVHELAHGLAIQRWGGKVRDAGVILLCLLPVPYVNASAAEAFRSRWQRALVSAAGILAELALAALALLAWLWLEPGLVRDAALVTIITGALSTLLVNGNPLMRFDGYYVLCDALDLRNLGPRSNRWWAGQASHRLLGTPAQAGADAVEPMPGERGWLLAYAPLAWLYRLVLSLAIVLWAGAWSAWLGLALGLWILFTLFLKPAWRLARATWRLIEAAPRPGPMALRALATVAGVAILLALPLPFSTLAQGVVWLPEDARIRAGTDGFITRVAVVDGQAVHRGDLLLSLEDSELDAELARLEAEHVDTETRLYRAITGDPREVPALREALAYVEAERARVRVRQADLEIRAGATGTVVLPGADELIGQFRARGDLLGHIATGEALVVRVALPQDDAALIREHAGRIDLRLVQAAATAHPARVQRETPAAIRELPSPALGDSGGGTIVTDVADPEGLATRRPVVLVDLEAATVHSPWVGSRVAVRFDHGYLSLSGQLLRQLRQLVLDRFDVLG